MSSYVLVGRKFHDKQWWNELVRACAVIGDPFEIHCWFDERSETAQAMRYGQLIPSGWHGGTVVRGTITREFLAYLTQMSKPSDTEIYNKMIPFFTIQFGTRLYSEHYGTEMTISRNVRENRAQIDRILGQMETHGRVYRDL